AMQGDGCQSVSWNHARVELTPQGAFVSDLGSSNGTYVNGQRIEARTALHPGDVIELGRTGPKLQIAAIELNGAMVASAASPQATAFEALPQAGGPRIMPAVSARGRAAPLAVTPAGAGDSQSSGGTTRMMLVKLQSSQRRSMFLVGASLFGIGVVVALVLFV